LFKSYFKGGVKYVEGGAPTGLKSVQTNAAGEKRLFWVKGNKNVRVNRVEMSVAAMNKGDCFILDAGREVYVYVGGKANKLEKLKAISMANQIRDQDHNGRATVSIVDEFSNELDQQHFFDLLGSGTPKTVPEDNTAPQDASYESKDASGVTLYKVSDASKKLQVTPLSQKPYKQEMLDTNVRVNY
jgi:gelsolin